MPTAQVNGAEMYYEEAGSGPGSVTDSCAITPWRKGAHSSRAIARKALAGTHRTNLIDIQ